MSAHSSEFPQFEVRMLFIGPWCTWVHLCIFEKSWQKGLTKKDRKTANVENRGKMYSLWRSITQYPIMLAILNMNHSIYIASNIKTTCQFGAVSQNSILWKIAKKTFFLGLPVTLFATIFQKCTGGLMYTTDQWITSVLQTEGPQKNELICRQVLDYIWRMVYE